MIFGHVTPIHHLMIMASSVSVGLGKGEQRSVRASASPIDPPPTPRYDPRALWCPEMARLHTALAEVAAAALNSDGREWMEVAGHRFSRVNPSYMSHR